MYIVLSSYMCGLCFKECWGNIFFLGITLENVYAGMLDILIGCVIFL